jgi:hypothetical protein
LEDAFEREEEPTARLTRSAFAEVGEAVRVAASGHQPARKRHDRGRVRVWPADGLLQRLELEVRHDRRLGGQRARASYQTHADGDREHARGPVH